MLLLNFKALVIVVWICSVKSIHGRVKDLTEAPEPDCNAPVLENGYIVGKNHSFFSGETAEVVCETGHRFLQSKSSIIHLLCRADGKWVDVLGNEEVPTCERIGSCALPQVAGGQVLSKPGGYMPGEEAPMRCQAVEEPFTILCQSDGSWKLRQGNSAWGPLPDYCPGKVRHCPLPSGIKHGGFSVFSIEGLDYVPDGSKVLFYCNSGYVLENEDNVDLTCLGGMLQGSEPQCILKKNTTVCLRPNSVANAFYSMYGGDPNREDDLYIEGTKLVYTCNTGYTLYGNPSRTCTASHWAGEAPTCVPGCSSPPSIAYGDYNFFGQNNVIESGRSSEGTKVYYFCDNGYRMKDKNMSTLRCLHGLWEGTLPVCKKRTACDPPMDIPHGNWVILSIYPDFRIGTRVKYECEKDYKAIGQSAMDCLRTGYWSEYAPKCLPKDGYCSEPDPIEHGFYMCDPNHCNLFKVGTNVHYLCNKGYEVVQGDITLMTCETGGAWTEANPVCNKITEGASADTIELTSSTLTIVIVTSSTILGLLLVVIVVVIFQRRNKPRHSHYSQRIRSGATAAILPPDGYERVHDARIIPPLDEHDRVALIAFADGIQVVLPSYEEATGSHSSQHGTGARLHHYNSDTGSSRSSGHSRGGGEYRPLPTLVHGLRHNGTTYLRELPASGDHHHHNQRDHHRNSIITTNSNVTRTGDSLSNAFGSIDTMNVSDNTSTTVTLGTYDSGASNPSLSHSQRAAAGSLASSSNPSLTTEDAPLIEQPDPALMLRSQTASPSIPEIEEEAEEATPDEELYK